MEKFVMELQTRLGEEGLKLQEPMKEHTTKLIPVNVVPSFATNCVFKSQKYFVPIQIKTEDKIAVPKKPL